VVGKEGLGPLLGRIHQADPQVRIHLIGHSFGARLVSFALAGLPDPANSPVKSLYLLQGAFSHFAFADALPMDRSRGGALKGMAARVDGPLVASFTVPDAFDFSAVRASNLAEAGESLREVAKAYADFYDRTESAPPWIGYLAEDETSGNIVGSCGYKGVCRDGMVEIAYFSFPPYERRGHAS
jgi:pimeloyl-ACP methyl ester carboxylesterase